MIMAHRRSSCRAPSRLFPSSFGSSLAAPVTLSHIGENMESLYGGARTSKGMFISKDQSLLQAFQNSQLILVAFHAINLLQCNLKAKTYNQKLLCLLSSPYVHIISDARISRMFSLTRSRRYCTQERIPGPAQLLSKSACPAGYTPSETYSPPATIAAHDFKFNAVTEISTQ